MRRTASGEHVPYAIRGFRQRGHRDVSRIESFSDAVFGFSVTLLVVSLQVPRTFDDLLRVLGGFPSFALTFALLAQIWYIQYRFFRRYALQDGPTIFLNIALLFVIVFFTYPLKFLFGSIFVVDGNEPIIRGDQIAQMYGVYAIGYVSVFAIFALLHVHALRKGEELALTPLEILDTRLSIGLAVFQIGVGLLSVGTAALFVSFGAYRTASIVGGFTYALIPIGITTIRFATRERRLELRKR